MSIQLFYENQSIISLDNILTILTALSAINIGFVAFVYPKIFETTKNLKDISQIFITKLDEKFYIHYYLKFIIYTLIINLFSIIILPLLDSEYYIWILIPNFIFSIFSICFSYYSFRILHQYYNNPEELFKVENIVLTPDVKNEDLELLQMIAIHSIQYQDDLSLFKIATKYICEIFNNNISWNEHKFEHNFLGLTKDNEYLFRPLEIMTYIFQRGVNLSKQEIANTIFNKQCELLENALLKWKHTNSFYVEQKTIKSYVQKFMYKLDRCNIIYDDIISLFDFYYILNNYYKNVFPNIIDNVNRKFMHPNEIVFPMMTTLIDDNYPFYLLTLWQDIINNYRHSDEIDRIQILKLNTQIISYLIYKGKYKEAYDYMYYETPKENHYEHNFPQMPCFLDEIFKCYLGKDSSFSQNQVFSKNQQSERYKFYTLFILLCNAKDRMDNLKQLNVNDFRQQYIQTEISRYSNSSQDFVNHLTNEELFFNYLNNIEKIRKILDDFFSNEELVSTFQINDSYKNYIIDKIILLHQKMDMRRKNILNSKLSQKQISEIKELKQDLYDALVPDNVINRIFGVKKEIPAIALKMALGNITITKEKGRLIVYDDFEQQIYRMLEEKMYGQLFQKLRSISKKISSVDEITAQNLSDYCIITNFRAAKDTLLKAFPIDRIIMNDVPIGAKGIKIGNVTINVSREDYFFSKNSAKRNTILFIDKSKVSLCKTGVKDIKVKEIKLNGDKKFDDLFNPEYTTNEEISITMSSFLDIIYEQNAIYSFEIKK